MRKRWKEVSLGLLNLLLVVAMIAAAQGILFKLYPHDRSTPPPVAGGAILAIAVFLAYVAGCRWIERRRPTELAANRAAPELAFGFAFGFALFMTVMAILQAMGVYHPAGWGSAGHLAAGLLFATLAGITEEILFRGLLFRLSSKIIGTWGALLLTAGLFGLAHMANPGATKTSALAIALEAGILLGAAYAATERLWVPIGMHIAWNFTEGSVFGMSVSGLNKVTGLIQGSLQGSRLLTGGAFGPEASIVAVAVCLVGALYFLYRMLRLHRVEPPVWSSAVRLDQPSTPASSSAT